MNTVDFEYLVHNIKTDELMGCDTSIANIFLYQEKYNTTLEICNNVLLRYNKIDSETSYFAFPIPLKNADSNWLFTTVKFILETCKTPHFHLVTETQKALIDECLAKISPTAKVLWESDRANTDYLYLQSDLSELAGNILQKKKNHINRFMRTYEGRWNFKSFPENLIKDDILKVEELWFQERNDADNSDLKIELEIIKNALEHAQLLNLRGGVLYVDNEPVAMTLASPISQSVLDIHFEKAVGESVKNGAYATINNLFAKTCGNFTYLNREEDLGIEGLRKAKLSYKPEILLHKFHGKVIQLFS